MKGPHGQHDRGFDQPMTDVTKIIVLKDGVVVETGSTRA